MRQNYIVRRSTESTMLKQTKDAACMEETKHITNLI
jgi:hypothetical protein